MVFYFFLVNLKWRKSGGNGWSHFILQISRLSWLILSCLYVLMALFSPLQTRVQNEVCSAWVCYLRGNTYSNSCGLIFLADGRSPNQSLYRGGGGYERQNNRGRGRYNNTSYNNRYQGGGGNRSWYNSDNRSGNQHNRRYIPEPPLVEMEPSKLMTSKEKEWIFKISIMSLLSGDFQASDYYFIVSSLVGGCIMLHIIRYSMRKLQHILNTWTN